ncbi:MAG: hypothetical protein IJ062_03000 [Firmicutes bacterium]|nr:hypothetical protein [Bacillota bacterium]
MRKSFFTKAIVAVGVMISAMAMSGVCAWANTVTWSYQSDTTTVPSEFGFSLNNISTLNTTTTADKSRKGTFTEAIFTTTDGTTGCIAKQTGYNLNTNTNNYMIKDDGTAYATSKYAFFSPTKSGTIKFYIFSNNSSTKADGLRFYNAEIREEASEAGAAAGTVKLGTQIGDNIELKHRDYVENNFTQDAIELEVTAGNKYVIYGNTACILYKMALEYEDEATLISETLDPIDGLTVNDDLTCSAEYAKVDGTHYLVLDFTKNEALAAANALTYSVTGQNPITINTLYTGVQFDADGDDAIGNDDHLYYAFKFTDEDNTYISINATISVAN